MKTSSLALLLMFSFITTSPAAVIHVPGDQPTIQAGIDAAAEGDTVLVADGLYRGPGNRDLNFRGKAITLQSAGGPLNCIIDAEGNLDFPRRCFNFHHGEGPDSVLRGFTLTGGHGSNRGGAIHIVGDSPTITGNIITGNTGNGGCGIGCSGGAPLIEHNIFHDNGYFSLSDGGAMYFEYASPIIRDNLLLENINYGGSGAGYFLGGAPLIEGNRFIGNASESILRDHDIGGALVLKEMGSDAVIRNNIFRENRADRGGAIHCVDADPEIIGNVFKSNTAGSEGGAIRCVRSSPKITGNRFSDNQAIWGAGINCSNDSNPVIDGCLFVGNRAGLSGGGFDCSWNSSPHIASCTFALNKAVSGHGGAISVDSGTTLLMHDSILWANEAPLGPQISVGHETSATTLTISYCDVQGGQSAVLVDPASTLEWGAGMIDADPCFAVGALGGFFLCHLDAGQAADSPCIDAGAPSGAPPSGSTRTDFVADSGLPDMGFHWATAGWLAAGPGPGRDNPPEVRLFMPAEDAEPQVSFSAYGVPRYGVNLAFGDLSDNGGMEIITGAGPGAMFGPHVRGFTSDGDPIPGISFMAYGTHKWGVNVACGDIDGNGDDEIITGAGPGAVFGPHVRAWNVDGLTASAIPGVSFFAYNTHSWGVVVACGDVDGDGFDELLTAPGPSPQFGAHVRGWKFDGSAVSPMPDVDFLAWNMATTAYGATLHGGPDLNRDGREEIFVGAGPDPDAASLVSVFRHDGSDIIRWFGLSPFGGMTHGATVAAGWVE